MDKYELHLVIDSKGLKEVRILGDGDNSLYQGRIIYLKIKPFFSDFNEKIKKLLYSENQDKENKKL